MDSMVPDRVGGHHDLVEHHAGLLDGAQHVASGDLVAGPGHGGEVPTSSPDPGRAPPRPGARLLFPAFRMMPSKGALDAVVDVLNDAGAQLHAHGRAGGLHHRAGAQAGGLLVHLDGRRIAVHVQNLADQALLAHPHHVGHVGVLQPRRHHQRAGDLDNFSRQCFNLLSRRRKLHILRVPVNGNAHSFRCASSSPPDPLRWAPPGVRTAIKAAPTAGRSGRRGDLHGRPSFRPLPMIRSLGLLRLRRGRVWAPAPTGRPTRYGRRGADAHIAPPLSAGGATKYPPQQHAPRPA